MNRAGTARVRCIVVWAAAISLVPFWTACAGCTPQVWIEADERIELSVDDVDRLAAVTHNGHVVGTAAEATDRITIEVSKRAGGQTEADAQECMEALEITTEKTGRQQKVGWVLSKPRAESWGIQVSFDVVLPSRLAVSALSHNGRIEVKGVGGDCQLETRNGRIHAQTTARKISAQTHNGRIDVTASSAEVALVTHNGAIEARLDAPGDVAGKITTLNGAVNVSLGDQTATNLTCSTYNGSITCQRELTAVSKTRRRLTGRLGDSEAKLIIETHNGAIEVN